jgi:hypothetical protein
MRPDIGHDIRIYWYGYRDHPDIWTHDIGIGCPDILPDSDVVPDIMTFPQPVLPLFPPPAAAAAAAAAAYSMLRNPCY